MVRPYLFSFLKIGKEFFSKYTKSFSLTLRTSLALTSLLFLSACACAGGGGIGGETNALSSLTLEINAAKYNVNFDDNRNARISARMSRLAPPHTAIVSNLELIEGSTAKDINGNSITGGSSVPLQISGDNLKVEINVTDKDGSSHIYTVIVQFINTEANIDSLTLTFSGNDYPISFDDDGNATINNAPSSLSNPPSHATIQSISFSDGATIKQNDTTITVGGPVSITDDPDNPNNPRKRSISLSITAEDGDTTRTYIVNFDIINSDANIDSLTLSLLGANYPVTFDNKRAIVNGLSYLRVNPDAVTITSISLSDSASVTDQNNTPVTVGSTVDITVDGNNRSFALSVTAEDNSISDHTVTLDFILPITLSGHLNEINSVAYNHDGSRLASGSANGSLSDNNTIKIWDATVTTDSSTPIATLSGHTDEVYSVDYNHNGSRLASGSRDSTIRIWDATVTANTSTPIATLSGHISGIRSLAYNHDGTRIVSGSNDSTIKIWDATVTTDSTTFLATFPDHVSPVFSVAYSPDGLKMVSSSWDKTVKIWDAIAMANIATLSGHTSWVRSVAYNNDGTRLVSGSNDRSIKIWDATVTANTATSIATLSDNDPNPDPNYFNPVLSVAYNNDSSKIVSGRRDNTLKIWDATVTTDTTTPLFTLVGHTDSVNSVAFHPDGSKIASGSDDKTIKIWR